MLKYPFLAIKKRLQDKVPDLLEVEWYVSQYLQNNEIHLITTPCAYIQFERLPTDQHQDGIQSAEMKVRIHCVSEALFSDSQRITDEVINHTGLADQIHIALNGWEAMLSDLPGQAALKGTDQDVVLVNRMVRSELLPDHSLSNLIATVQTYEAMAFDYSARPAWIEKVANLKIPK
ncbi:MAG: hypothetical protein M3Q97_08430 [Bacteroidota bacterium]|nr:hypothetical protein [Bacteroidota bacterium]